MKPLTIKLTKKRLKTLTTLANGADLNTTATKLLNTTLDGSAKLLALSKKTADCINKLKQEFNNGSSSPL